MATLTTLGTKCLETINCSQKTRISTCKNQNKTLFKLVTLHWIFAADAWCSETRNNTIFVGGKCVSNKHCRNILSHPQNKAQMISESLLPTDYWGRGNPLKPYLKNRVTKDFERLSLFHSITGGQWKFKIHIHGLYGWDEHAEWPPKTAKAKF